MMMASLAAEPERRITQDEVVSFPGVAAEEVRISPLPVAGTIGYLQRKHAVQAVYEGAYALVERNLIRRGYVPRLYAGLFLHDQPIGLMKWQVISRSLSDKANTTATLNPADNATTSLTPAQRSGPARRLLARSGSFPLRPDPRYKVTYHVYDTDVYLPQTWVAFLEAIAAASAHDWLAEGAYVNAVSPSGDVAVNMHGTGYPSGLNWDHLVHTLLGLWDEMVASHDHKEWDWQLSFEGRQIGEGFIFKLES